MKLPLRRIAEFISASGEFDPHAVADGYSIDSRTIQPGELFFAVKGERLDGHDYVEQALERGAIAAVIAQDRAAPFAVKARLLCVPDTLAALQQLGAAVRRVWGKKLIAITGSAGKTTTKEAIAHILSTRYRVLKSEGNLNNHFGLPLQLLRLEPEHDIAVMELGMSSPGEITLLAEVARPDCGVITNVGAAHLGFFTSVAEIARAKYELIERLPSGATAVLNADDEYVSQFGRDFHGKVVTYALKHPADVRAEAVESRGGGGSEFDVVIGPVRHRAHLPLIGTHNIYNALAGVAVGLEYGLEPGQAVHALADLRPGDKRGQVLEIAGATVLNDCYNSNPKALDAMVNTLVSVQARRRIVVAGEMLELGAGAADLHRQCGEHMAAAGIDLVVGVRGEARSLVEGAKDAGAQALFFNSPAEAGEWLTREVRAGDAVLLKGSRGVKLETALEVWQQSLSTVRS
jgi:UDP-N-acetylmuramoyl-tripeptide--D-alanyl-D-alanine ligase